MKIRGEELDRWARFRRFPLSGVNKAGLVLAMLLALIDVPSAFYTPPVGMASPGRVALVLASVCGVVSAGSIVHGWLRYSPSAISAVVVTRVLSMFLGVGAFLVSPVESSVRVFALASVPLTLFSVALVLTSWDPGASATD